MSEYSHLPTPEWIAANISVFGGEVIVFGLSQEMADDLLRFAADKKITGDGTNEIQLNRIPVYGPGYDLGKLKGKGFDPRGHVEVSLGHTAICHRTLFAAIGVPADKIR